MMEKGTTPHHKIAHVITESTPFGGAQRNTLLTLKGLVRDGYETELICGPGGRLIQEARTIGVPVHVMPDLVRRIDLLKDCRAVMQLRRLFRQRQYSLVHTHSTKAGLLGRLAAWWAGVPVIVHTFHGVLLEMDGSLGSRLYIAAERLVGRLTHCFICVGEVVRQEILTWRLAPDERFVTIYSGIEFSSYVPKRTVPDTKHGLGMEEAWPIVGSIGHLLEAKAQHDLIEAVRLLREKYPQMKLLIVGEGNRRSALERQIRENGLAHNVSLLGERDDIADLLGIFDVYAMSSQREGIGRALTEAMYWSLPIVASSVNGVKEVILHEQTGLLVPPHDPQALAAAIDRLASVRELAQRLGVNAHAKATELMDGQQMIGAIERLYDELSRRLIWPQLTSSSIPPAVSETSSQI